MDTLGINKDHKSSPSTTSTSRIETINGSYQWKFSGYNLSKGLGIGKYIASDTFMVGGYPWAIYFYPDGKSVEDNATYVSLFIALASEGFDVRALFELTLLDQSGKGRHKVHTHFGRTLDNGPYKLQRHGSMWGYKRFLRRINLESSDYLKDDSLSIRCCVGVVIGAGAWAPSYGALPSKGVNNAHVVVEGSGSSAANIHPIQDKDTQEKSRKRNVDGARLRSSKKRKVRGGKLEGDVKLSQQIDCLIEAIEKSTV